MAVAVALAAAWIDLAFGLFGWHQQYACMHGGCILSEVKATEWW